MNAVSAATEIRTLMDSIGEAAVAASQVLAGVATATKNAALQSAATTMRQRKDASFAANRLDLQQARERGLSDALIDRLSLDDQRIEAMARGIEAIVALADPIGTIITEWTRPNGI